MEIKGERYDSLDGLRSIMCIAIVAMHVLTNVTIKPTTNWFFNIILYSGNFTLLFMIVSAFSMCCGYYEKIKYNKINLNEFYKKRYQRILPFYVLLLLISITVEPSINNVIEAFTSITLIQSLLPNNNISVIGVGWFLSVVFVFYMLFPFFVFLINNKRRAILIGCIAIILNFLCVGYFSSPELVIKKISRLNFIFDLPYFFVGGSLYLYRDKIRSFSKYKFLLGIFILFFLYLFFRIKNVNYYCYFFIELLFFILLMIYAIMESGKSMLNNILTNFISKISMEIYLCHMMCFRLIEKLCMNIISDENLHYVCVLILTLCTAILFAFIFKRLEYILINKIKLFGFN